MGELGMGIISLVCFRMSMKMYVLLGCNFLNLEEKEEVCGWRMFDWDAVGWSLSFLNLDES